MCTVTLVPNAHGFILTSNRDEHISRKPSLAPSVENGILFPKDGEAGGTWIAASDFGRTVCLLNGAFEKHQRKQAYRKSRGLVVKELFEYSTIQDFAEQYNFTDIEPFTLVWVETEPQMQFFELRLDEQKVHLKALETDKTHIWSSSTLYNGDIRKMRENWFADWKKEGVLDAEMLMNFHQKAGIGDVENDVRMLRPNGVRTVSTTQIVFDGTEFAMQHTNYILNQSNIEKLKKASVLK